MRNKLKRPSPAMAVALLALFVALGGSSYAALKVGSKQVRNNSVRSIDLRNNDVRSRDIRNNTILGRDVVEANLGKVPAAAAADTASTVDQIRRTDVVRAQPSSFGPHLDFALAAAAKVPLLEFGEFSLYGKCVSDTDGTTDEDGDGDPDNNAGTHARIYIESSEANALFAAGRDALSGEQAFLGPGTAEEDRELTTTRGEPNGAGTAAGGGDSGFSVATARGDTFWGDAGAAAKNGITPAGDGAYGAGDACLFWAQVID